MTTLWAASTPSTARYVGDWPTEREDCRAAIEPASWWRPSPESAYLVLTDRGAGRLAVWELIDASRLRPQYASRTVEFPCPFATTASATMTRSCDGREIRVTYDASCADPFGGGRDTERAWIAHTADGLDAVEISEHLVGY
jgi:hypothetical protein